VTHLPLSMDAAAVVAYSSRRCRLWPVPVPALMLQHAVTAAYRGTLAGSAGRFSPRAVYYLGGDSPDVWQDRA